jgi:tripartite-type tricarboxylate transporter receptor subunit TctC
MAGIEVSVVPYPSGSEAIAALMGGHVHVLFEEIGPKRAFVDSGDFTPIMAFLDRRVYEYDFVADVPSTYELGWEVQLGRWRGMMVRNGTDPEIIQILFDALSEAMNSPLYLEHEAEGMLDIRPGLLGPEEFGEFLRAELEAYRPVIYALDMFPD